MVNIKRLMDADGTGEYFRRAYDPKYYFTSEGYSDKGEEKMEDRKGAVRPSHYKVEGEPECIEIMLTKQHVNDVYTDYNRYQAFKYIWRAGKKGDVKEDLEKARAFINFALEALETNKK